MVGWYHGLSLFLIHSHPQGFHQSFEFEISICSGFSCEVTNLGFAHVGCRIRVQDSDLGQDGAQSKEGRKDGVPHHS